MFRRKERAICLPPPPFNKSWRGWGVLFWSAGQKYSPMGQVNMDTYHFHVLKKHYF